MKTIKSMFVIMIALMVIGVAAGAVYTEYRNNTATAEMTIEKPNNCDVETLVSNDGVNFSESIVLDNVIGGDTIVLTFSHENTGQNEYVFGTVSYEIECKEGLDFKGPCEGTINDFYDSEPSILMLPIPVDECGFVYAGIVYTNTYGESYSVNTPEYVTRMNNKEASVTPHDYDVFSGTKYTKVEMTPRTDAYGSYEIRGTVDPVVFERIPIEYQDKINETL
jgi:hypothetical protein